MDILKVYLAGGFRSDWQEHVEKSVRGFEFINPKINWSEKILTRPEEYWLWNICGVRSADIIFVYIEDYVPD